MTVTEKHSIAKMFGKAIFYASIQFAAGSVEMSSKFSINSFAKDQDTLNKAAQALKGYMMIAALWTAGTMLVMYGNYGKTGAVVGFIANAGIVAWIYFSYIASFKEAARKHNLKEPCVFC